MGHSKSKYHACATCVHFVAERIDGNMIYRCGRLGYHTKPAYQFNCCEPKPHIVKLMKKESSEE